MLAEPVGRSIHPVLSLCCRSQRSAAGTAALIVPSRTSLASIWCLDGIQIHHDVLELVSSCSGALRRCREARKSGKSSREPAGALASQRAGKTLKDVIKIKKSFDPSAILILYFCSCFMGSLKYTTAFYWFSKNSSPIASSKQKSLI